MKGGVNGAYSGEREHLFRPNVNTCFRNASRKALLSLSVHVGQVALLFSHRFSFELEPVGVVQDPAPASGYNSPSARGPAYSAASRNLLRGDHSTDRANVGWTKFDQCRWFTLVRILRIQLLPPRP